METLRQIKHIKNGGLEQAFMEIANEQGLLSDKDKQRLAHLKTLPQNRSEVLSEFDMMNKSDIKNK